MSDTPPTTPSAAEPPITPEQVHKDMFHCHTPRGHYHDDATYIDIIQAEGLVLYYLGQYKKELQRLQARIDELAVALVVEQAHVAELREQLAEARGDSGPDPIVEWKGWKVELDFGEEGNDD